VTEKPSAGAIPDRCSLPFLFGKGTKDTQLAMNKASGAFTNSKTRSCHLLSILCAEEQANCGEDCRETLQVPTWNNAGFPNKVRQLRAIGEWQ
jgi:hypothetical protein